MSELGVRGLCHIRVPPRVRGGAPEFTVRADGPVVNKHGWEQGALNPDGTSKPADEIDFGQDSGIGFFLLPLPASAPCFALLRLVFVGEYFCVKQHSLLKALVLPLRWRAEHFTCSICDDDGDDDSDSDAGVQMTYEESSNKNGPQRTSRRRGGPAGSKTKRKKQRTDGFSVPSTQRGTLIHQSSRGWAPSSDASSNKSKHRETSRRVNLGTNFTAVAMGTFTGLTNHLKSRRTRIERHINPYSDAMDSKFDIIDNDKTQEIVFLRQSHDLADRKILETQAANEALQKELDELKSAATAGARFEELEKAQAANAALRKKVQALADKQRIHDLDSDVNENVPRPANIQNEMGLGGNANDREQYLAIMRNMHDLTHQASINWEQPRAKTPAGAKEKLFAVARERHPILKRYENDWATEELVKQYIKNKRRHGYRKGFLERPAQYDYLKTNSAKRNPSAPRGPRVAVRRSKKVAEKKAAVKAKGKSKAKPRTKQVVEDDDESMSDEPGLSRDRGGSEEEGSGVIYGTDPGLIGPGQAAFGLPGPIRPECFPGPY
ncbi:hypothetical protein B0H14DRAFT_3454699 [Mycena olivaceomarginata]|nr:hypothetical protein B0H14DRAFT_3454699 [Mycena olivaceomarginata]